MPSSGDRPEDHLPSVADRAIDPKQSLIQNMRADSLVPRGIRSVLLNAIILVVGLVFLATGIGYLLEDVSWAGPWGMFHPHGLIFAALNGGIGFWCTYGAITNLRARKNAPQ